MNNLPKSNRRCYGKYAKVFITKKSTQRKTLHTLKADVFESPDNKNIGKLFSK